ncbi:MAG: hypothetical protein AAGJ40_17295 [Planctomycetota bacterium]
MKPKRILFLSVATIACCLVIAGAIYASIDRPAPVSPLRVALSKVSLGSTADEADAALGLTPVSVSTIDGYLMGPMTMLSAENALTPKDQIEAFSLRKYVDNDCYAVVALRGDGRVAGKWAVSTDNGG